MQNGNKTPDKESLNDEKLNEIKLNEIVTLQGVYDVFIPIFHHIFCKSYNHFVKAVYNLKCEEEIGRKSLYIEYNGV